MNAKLTCKFIPKAEHTKLFKLSCHLQPAQCHQNMCAKLDQSDHCKRVSKFFVKQHLMKHQHLRQGIHQLTPLSNVKITESMIMSIWQIQTNLQSLNFIGQDLFGKCNFHFCLSFLTINSDHDLQKWYKAQKGLSCKI